MFRHLTNKYPTELFVYMDDILIATGGDLPRHRQIVHEVLDLLEEESYFLKPSKCVFEQPQIEYLGIIVNGDHIKIDPVKADGLCDWPWDLKTLKEVRSALGVLGYQRPFIPNFANIARPLTQLLKKGTPFQWTPECHEALDKLISTVLTDPALQQPDMTKPFQLEVDASAFATGTILSQKDDRGKSCAIGFHSKTFTEAEWNYDIHNRELLCYILELFYSFFFILPMSNLFYATHGDSQAWLMWPPTIHTCDLVCSCVSIVVVTSIVPCDLLSHVDGLWLQLYCSGDIIGHIRTPYCSLWPIVLVTPLFSWRLLYSLLYCSCLL